MKSIKCILVFALIIQNISAQQNTMKDFAATDKKALQIPDSLTSSTKTIANFIQSNFATEQEKVRAIFIWVASNIQYDIENMFAINYYATQEDKINKALATRKGICENYAAVFNDICLKCGIKCYVIEGYTKQNGAADFIPHAWCAAFINNTWLMFDPTWASGFVNNGKFYKKINNNYFSALPSALIKTHMPFDYLWQFLNYPVSNQEFYEGKTTQNTTKPFYNFVDSLKAYEAENHVEQLTSTAYRIEKNGVKNAMIFDRLQHIKVKLENNKIQIENDRRNKLATLYNIAVAKYNNAVNNLNDFISYRNHQFLPQQPDSVIQNMIDTVNAEVSTAKAQLDQIENPDSTSALLITQLYKAIKDINFHTGEQQDWLSEYFSKSKSKRKSMFYEKKITWFGVPLN